MRRLRELLQRLRDDESGVTAIEYGLIAGLIGAVLIVALGTFGDRIENVFDALTDRLDDAENQIASEQTTR